MDPKIRAVLLALCLLLAATYARAQEESSEIGSESPSEEVQTNERSVEQVPNVGGGKVTLISNKNTLTHIQQAPKYLDHNMLQEQSEKFNAEEKNKKTSEEDMKGARESDNKKETKGEQDQKKAVEEGQKKAVQEAADKKAAEEKSKADEADKKKE